MRTQKQWEELCRKYITGGYVPGGKRKRKNLYNSGKKYVDSIIRPLNLWSDGDVILDVGCGNGRIAMQLVDDGIVYHGVDIVEKCHDFCTIAFAEYINFHFFHLDIRSDRYNKDGELSALEFSMPLIIDSSIDVVLASSLFTHLGKIEVSEHYLAEIARVAKIGARFYSTWFTNPPYDEDDSEEKTSYRREDIITIIERHFDIKRAWNGDNIESGKQMKVVGWRI